MKILKQIKTWGLTTALVGSFVAFADWWCPNCQRYHCDYECCPYGCNDLLSIPDFDSDGARSRLDRRRQRMLTELRRDGARIQHGHQQNMSNICSSMWKHVHTPADVQQIYGALRQIADGKGISMPPMPGFHGGYGCHPYGGFAPQPAFGYGCQPGFGSYDGFNCQPWGCGFECEDDFGYDCHPYGCFDDGFGYGCQYYGGGFGCDDDYGYNCNHYGYQCDPYGCYYY